MDVRVGPKKGWTSKNWCFWTVVLEKTFESPLDSKEIQPVYPRGNQSWIFIGRADAEAEAAILWPPDMKKRLIGKDPDAGKYWRREKIRSDQSLSRVFATPWTAAHQASLSTISCSLHKLMSIESVMPSNHLILCRPLLLLPSIFPSIRSFPMSQLFTSSGQVLELQLQYQSLQWVFRVDFP